jgi:hypothetical protein
MKPILIALAVSLSAAPAFAQQQQQQCGPYTGMVRMLTERYGEAVQVEGLAASATLVQWWANTETGTWSVIYLHPNGLACFLASGQNHVEVYETAPRGQPG